MDADAQSHQANGRHPGHHGPHGQHGHQRAAALGLATATGAVKSIGETTFALATDQGDLAVTTGPDTNFHGLSRNEARELGYQEAELALINTFAGLKVGQHVGVIGQRQGHGTLLARGVHFPIPPSFGARTTTVQERTPDRGGHGHGGGGHSHGPNGRGGEGKGMFDPANIARLLGEKRRAKMPPEATLRAAGVAAGQTLVDLGCGPGYFTLPAAELVGPRGWVYGVDVQAEMIEACRKRAVEAGTRQLELVLSTETHVPLPDGIADRVLISVVLHEIKDRAAFLREARRLLKPGGRISLIEFRKQDGPPGPPKERRLSEADVAAVAGAAGLRVREQRALDDLHIFFHLASI